MLHPSYARGPETYRGATSEIDAFRADGGGCANPDGGLGLLLQCSTNADCLAVYANVAPSGSLFATCFGGACRAAESCIDTHLGVPNYCSCGADELPSGCSGSTPLCVRLTGASAPACVARCSTP